MLCSHQFPVLLSLNGKYQNLTSKSEQTLGKVFIAEYTLSHSISPPLPLSLCVFWPNPCVRVVMCCGALLLQLPNIYYLFLHYIHLVLLFLLLSLVLAFIFQFVCLLVQCRVAHHTFALTSYYNTRNALRYFLMCIRTYRAINAP